MTKRTKHLQEVSKQLLTRYLAKSIPDLEKNFRTVDRFASSGGLKMRKMPPHIDIAHRKVATRSVGMQVAMAKLKGAKPGRSYANINGVEGIKLRKEETNLNEISSGTLSRYLVKRAFWHASPDGMYNTLKAGASFVSNSIRQGSVNKGLQKTLQKSPSSKKALKINKGMVRAQEILRKRDSLGEESMEHHSKSDMAHIHHLVSQKLPRGHIIHGIVISHYSPNYVVVKTAHKKELHNVQYHHLMRNKKTGEFEHKFITRHVKEETALTENMAGDILGKAFPKPGIRKSTAFALGATGGFAGGAYAEHKAARYLARRKAAEYRKHQKESVDHLNEISTGTLASYAKKAVPEIAHHYHTPGKTSARKFLNRYQGVSKARRIMFKRGVDKRALPHPDAFRKYVPNYAEEAGDNMPKEDQKEIYENELAKTFTKIALQEGFPVATVAKSAGGAAKKSLRKRIFGHISKHEKKYALAGAAALTAGAIHNRHESVDRTVRHELSKDIRHPAKFLKHHLGKPGRDAMHIQRAAMKAAAVTAAGVGGYLAGGAASQYLNMGDDSNAEGSVLSEKAPPGAKYERMVMHIKGAHPSKKQKEIAFATAWKRYNAEHGGHPHHNTEAVDPEFIKKGKKFVHDAEHAIGRHKAVMGKVERGLARTAMAGTAAGIALVGYGIYKGGKAEVERLGNDMNKMKHKTKAGGQGMKEETAQIIDEGMAAEIYTKIAEYKKMGFRVTDVHVSENGGSFVCVDKEGVARKHVYQNGKRRVENMGSAKPPMNDDGDNDEDDMPRKKRGKFKHKVKK